MSPNSSRGTSGLPKLAVCHQSYASPSGCPFGARGPPPFRDTPALATDQSNTSLPDALPGDAELSLAYQAIKAKRRASMISNHTQSSPTPLVQSPTVAVDSHHFGHVSPSPSIASASNCPIRFLGHMSPEEVAEYFKNHKHELPKSHESCVKRHQSNTESIRELDAKYVNLVSMIQGLGEKHQPLLSERRGEGETVDKIKHWAAGLEQDRGELESAAVAEVYPVAQSTETARLDTQVDAQLKEIKLGESPTRPWGLHVPATANSPSTSTPCVLSMCDEQPNSILTPSLGRKFLNSNSEAPSKIESGENHPLPNKFTCPETTCRASEAVEFESFAALARHYLNEHDDTTDESHHREPPPAPDESPAPKASTTVPPPMYFTGPIFIGYSAQEAIDISRQLSKDS